jgi:hypothetical protein
MSWTTFSNGFFDDRVCCLIFDPVNVTMSQKLSLHQSANSVSRMLTADIIDTAIGAELLCASRFTWCRSWPSRCEQFSGTQDRIRTGSSEAVASEIPMCAICGATFPERRAIPTYSDVAGVTAPHAGHQSPFLPSNFRVVAPLTIRRPKAKSNAGIKRSKTASCWRTTIRPAILKPASAVRRSL